MEQVERGHITALIMPEDLIFKEHLELLESSGKGQEMMTENSQALILDRLVLKPSINSLGSSNEDAIPIFW